MRRGRLRSRASLRPDGRRAPTPVADEPATPRELPGLAGPTADDPLKLYVRQIGDGRLLTPAQERELARRKDEGDEAAKRKLIESQPPARDVDHAQLHARGRPAPRSHPGRQPRTHSRRREVRLHDGLQALDLCDLVDQAGDLARARRAGAHDPPPGPRRRPGAQGDEDAPPARTEAQPRPVARRDRGRDRDHARARAGAARAHPRPGQPRDPDRRRRLERRRPDPGHERAAARGRDGRQRRARPSSSTRSTSSSRASGASSSSASGSTASARARSRRSARTSASRASACVSSKRVRSASSARSRRALELYLRGS